MKEGSSRAIWAARSKPPPANFKSKLNEAGVSFAVQAGACDKSIVTPSNCSPNSAVAGAVRPLRPIVSASDFTLRLAERRLHRDVAELADDGKILPQRQRGAQLVAELVTNRRCVAVRDDVFPEVGDLFA